MPSGIYCAVPPCRLRHRPAGGGCGLQRRLHRRTGWPGAAARQRRLLGVTAWSQLPGTAIQQQGCDFPAALMKGGSALLLPGLYCSPFYLHAMLCSGPVNYVSSMPECLQLPLNPLCHANTCIVTPHLHYPLFYIIRNLMQSSSPRVIKLSRPGTRQERPSRGRGSAACCPPTRASRPLPRLLQSPPGPPPAQHAAWQRGPGTAVPPVHGPASPWLR